MHTGALLVAVLAKQGVLRGILQLLGHRDLDALGAVLQKRLTSLTTIAQPGRKVVDLTSATEMEG